MKHSDSLSEKQLKPMNKLFWAFAAIAFLGFLDATYLTLSHYTGISLSCGLQDTCSIVTTSRYSMFFGIPVALGGALYYLAALILALFYIDTQSAKVAKFLGFFTIIGLLSSAWFVYVQLGILHAICYYCMASATTSTLLFILGMTLLARLKNNPHPHGKS